MNWKNQSLKTNNRVQGVYKRIEGKNFRKGTEPVGVAAELQVCIRDRGLSFIISAGSPASLNEGFLGFSQSL
jgi:hypothetical protein